MTLYALDGRDQLNLGIRDGERQHTSVDNNIDGIYQRSINARLSLAGVIKELDNLSLEY